MPLTQRIGSRFVAHRSGVSLIRYLLRATFDAANQGYTNAQVLDTVAEGVQDGQLTVVEVDGTLAIVGNKLAFTAQATPAWGDQGFYSQAITRALGRGLLGTANVDATDTWTAIQWNDNADAGEANRVYQYQFRNTAALRISVYDGAGGVLEVPNVATYSASTDYQLAIVLGGYSAANGVPWRQGEAAAGYLFGAAFFIKGGAFANWTLLWRTSQGNTATLYAAFGNYNANGTIELPSGVPDANLSAVLQPTCLSTFTAANGTSLDAITPEVGAVWVEQAGNWDMQGNKANIASTDTVAIATVAAGISDVLIDVVVNAVHTDSYPGLAVRYTGASNFWMCRLTTDDKIELREVNGGSGTLRASAVVIIDPANDYNLRSIAYGQTIDVFVSGGNKITYGSAALNQTVGVHGLYGYRNATTHDNFLIMPRTSSVYDAVLNSV